MRRDIIEGVEREFESADYRVAASKGSFDMVAAGKDSMLVKTLFNIDSATLGEAGRLSTAASALDATPIFVGVKTRKGVMGEAVYRRFGVPAVSIESLHLILEQRPVSYIEKGGAVVYIDGDKMRQRREHLGLSLGCVSREAGVSRNSIAEYEKGGRARPAVAERIENLLGIKIIINDSRPIVPEGRREKPRGLEAFVSRKLAALGFDTRKISKAVFNIVARNGGVILANASEGNNFKKGADMLRNISEVTGKQAVFVSRNFYKNSVGGVPVITRNELEEINEIGALEDLIAGRI